MCVSFGVAVFEIQLRNVVKVLYNVSLAVKFSGVAFK